MINLTNLINYYISNSQQKKSSDKKTYIYDIYTNRFEEDNCTTNVEDLNFENKTVNKKKVEYNEVTNPDNIFFHYKKKLFHSKRRFKPIYPSNEKEVFPNS